MPIFTLNTNVKATDVPSDFLSSISTLIGDMLSKPESYVAVHINTDQQLSFGGSTNPAAFGTLMSIGGIEASRNRDHSNKLFDHINKKLGIPKNRMYIHFVNLRGSDVGWNESNMKIVPFYLINTVCNDSAVDFSTQLRGFCKF
ncbi:Macrophage migration inhibitory factor -like protein [Trichinella zimbabwensis]|uniref:L-dopachrome isomerase n=1 Tax=Trichinella zimbabwensis TaxID=268475 RepID=A0A0V1I7S0_9BILA|nr:Macrophage migration inhibitory factor -like protein [Trichinella zimbabwensis]